MLRKGPKIKLVETRRGCEMLERTPRFDVLVDGKFYSQLYFNMRGYCGQLPAPSTDRPGESICVPLSDEKIGAIKRLASILNKEWEIHETKATA